MRRFAILGAGADVGRVICFALAQSELIRHGDELVFIGREGGKSAFIVRGMAEDFSEAFADRGIRFIASVKPEEAWGDVVILVASAPDPSHFTRIFHRERLAEDNCRLFLRLAPVLRENRHRIGWVIVVTNPNEVGVHIFSEALETQRVIAIGALVDSYRFRLELAKEISVAPERITAWAGGEHGPEMLFFWGMVRVNGTPLDEPLRRQLACSSRDEFERRKAEAFDQMKKVLASEGIEAAYEALSPFPVEVRAVVKSYLTHASGAKTGGVASRAVLELMHAIFSETPTLLVAQTPSPVGTIGVPITISREGLIPRLDALEESEQEALFRVGEKVRWKTESLCQKIRG